MSRTIRKSWLNVKNVKAFYVAGSKSEPWMWLNVTYEERVELRKEEFDDSYRDGNAGYGCLKRLVKESAKKKVRSRSRQENHRLMNDPDYITRDFARDTRGEMWFWD